MFHVHGRKFFLAPPPRPGGPYYIRFEPPSNCRGRIRAVHRSLRTTVVAAAKERAKRIIEPILNGQWEIAEKLKSKSGHAAAMIALASSRQSRRDEFGGVCQPRTAPKARRIAALVSPSPVEGVLFEIGSTQRSVGACTASRAFDMGCLVCCGTPNPRFQKLLLLSKHFLAIRNRTSLATSCMRTDLTRMRRSKVRLVVRQLVVTESYKHRLFV